MAFPIATASVKITPDFTGFAASTRAGTQAALGATAASARTLGAGISAAVTLPVAAVGVTAVNSFRDFNQAMVESQAIMGDLTNDEMARMEEAARDVGKTTTFSATQAAESFFFLASAGLDAEQSIGALPAVARFAQAGMFDMATATDLATDAQSALGLTVPDTVKNLENLERVTDVLVGANTLANASVEQFSESLTTKAGTALKILNKDVEEGVAVLALYADRGIKGQIAGELLSRTLKFLNIRAVENAEEFERLGIRVFDANGKMRNLADISGDLTDALGDLSDEERTAELNTLGFTGRTQDAILTLIGGEAQIRSYETALRDMGGITQQVAEKQLQSFDAQLKLAGARITDVAITLGKELIPVVLTAVEGIASLVEVFAAAPAPIKRAVGLLAAFGALAGPILLIGGSIARTILSFRALSATSTVGTANATAYAAAQTRAAAATNALGVASGRAATGVGALSNAQLRGSVVPGAGAAGGAGRLAGLARGASFAAGGFIAGDLVAGFVQGIETEEGTVGDTVKDVTGNAVRFGATGAGIGLAIGGPVGAGIGAAIGGIGGGILGFFTSNQGQSEIESASEQVRAGIAEVLTGLDLSDREQAAAAQVLDAAIQSVIQGGIESGLSTIEAAGLGDQAEEAILRLLELGIDPVTAGDAVREKLVTGLEAGLSPNEIAASISGEIARGELGLGQNIGAGIAGEIAEGFEEELPASFQEVFAAAVEGGATVLKAIQIGLLSGAPLDLAFITDQIAGQISTVPSIFENQFEAAKGVSTQKMLELAQANADAFATFETNIRTLAESGLFALADTLAQKGPAAAAEAAALAEDIPTAIAIEAELSELGRDSVEAFLEEFEGADAAATAEAFIAEFVDPIAMAASKEEADQIASDFTNTIQNVVDTAPTSAFNNYASRAVTGIESNLSPAVARSIANSFISTIQSTFAGASLTPPSVSAPPAAPGVRPDNVGAGVLQAPAAFRQTNIEIINPTVQSADRDAVKAVVLDRLAGAI